MKTALFHEQSAMEKLLEQRVHLKHTIFVPLRWFNSFSDRVVDAFINEMTPKELYGKTVLLKRVDLFN